MLPKWTLLPTLILLRNFGRYSNLTFDQLSEVSIPFLRWVWRANRGHSCLILDLHAFYLLRQILLLSLFSGQRTWTSFVTFSAFLFLNDSFLSTNEKKHNRSAYVLFHFGSANGKRPVLNWHVYRFTPILFLNQNVNWSPQFRFSLLTFIISVI